MIDNSTMWTLNEINSSHHNYKTDAAGVKINLASARLEVFIMFPRTIIKSVVAITAILSTCTFSINTVFAEENSEASSDEQTLVITANRSEQNVNDTLAAVEVFTREDIERAQPESITDLLETVAGFDLVYNGGAGQSSSLFTRGSNSDHTLILVDGVRVGSATLGNKSFETIPVAQIERIEIVKGPRAALWGSDAIAGVIQIFTRRLENNEYSVAASVGSDSYQSTNFSYGFGSAKIKNTLTASYQNSDGFDVFDDSTGAVPDSEPDDDGYQKISAAIRGDYSLSDATTLDWVFQYDQGDNSFDNAFGANENEYRNSLWNIRYSYVEDKLLAQFSVKQSNDKSFSYDSRAAMKIGSDFKTKRSQINGFAQYDFNESVKLAGGVEHYKDDIGGSRSLQFDGSFAAFDQTQRNSDAVFVSSIVNVGKIIGEASARYDDIEKVGSERTFNLSLGYKVLDNVTLAVSRAKGFKAPSFNDLYFPGFGNPELVSEVSYNTEFLLKAHWQQQSITVVSFDNQVDQLINFVYDPDTFAFLPYNVDNASLKGHEVVYQYRSGRLSHKLSASFVDAIDKSLGFDGESLNEQLLRRAKEHYGYELSADLGDFSLFTQFNYIGRRRDNDFSSFPATEVYLKGHINVNLGATYQWNDNLSFKLKVSDLTDEAERTIANYNAPGQQIYFTAQYRNF